MSLTVIPVRRSISSSKSRNGRPNRDATFRPTDDFPAPGNPTRITWSITGGHSGDDRGAAAPHAVGLTMREPMAAM